MKSEKNNITQSYDRTVFEPSELPVSKNEIIGFSGNTGGSLVLIFTLNCVKPQPKTNQSFVVSFDIEDSVRPVIHSLIAYPIGKGHINSAKQELQIPFKKLMIAFMPLTN